MGRPSLEVLSTHGRDLERWQERVDALPANKQDVYLLPMYSALYESEFGEPTFLLQYQDERGTVLMVAAHRSLKDLPFYDSASSSGSSVCCDIASPYGYGGPIIHVPDGGSEHLLFLDFREALHDYCLENGVVAEFLRLNPLTQNHKLFGQDPGLRRKNSTISIDLRQSECEIWRGMENNRRARVKKAESSGVEMVLSDFRQDHLLEFHRLYTDSMERLDALPMYFFSLDFFQEMVSRMADHAALFLGMWNRKVISGQLFLHGGQYVDYYLSGSDTELWDLHGNVLGIYKAALWAKEQGYQSLHLGGGHGCENDSLFAFKSQFSPNQAPYYMYQQVHDPEGYASLCRLKREFDGNEQPQSAASPGKDAVLVDYFPEYRG